MLLWYHFLHHSLPPRDSELLPQTHPQGLSHAFLLSTHSQRQ